MLTQGGGPGVATGPRHENYWYVLCPGGEENDFIRAVREIMQNTGRAAQKDAVDSRARRVCKRLAWQARGAVDRGMQMITDLRGLDILFVTGTDGSHENRGTGDTWYACTRPVIVGQQQASPSNTLCDPISCPSRGEFAGGSFLRTGRALISWLNFELRLRNCLTSISVPLYRLAVDRVSYE